MMAGGLTAAEKTARAVALTRAEAERRPADGAAHQAEPYHGMAPPPSTEPPVPPAMPPIAAATDADVARLPATIWAGTPVDRWAKSDRGLQRWRPIVDHVNIVELPDGARQFEQSGCRPLRLDAELAAHLAWLLMPEEWRVALAGRFEAAGWPPGASGSGERA